MKKKSEFLSGNFHFFLVVKFSIYLNRRVFVMVYEGGNFLSLKAVSLFFLFFFFFFFCKILQNVSDVSIYLKLTAWLHRLIWMFLVQICIKPLFFSDTDQYACIVLALYLFNIVIIVLACIAEIDNKISMCLKCLYVFIRFHISICIVTSFFEMK